MAASYAHLGALVGAYRIHAGWDVQAAATAAEVTVTTWQEFEKKGTGLGVRRIGEIASALDIPREALTEVADPLAVLSAVWGEGLGAFLREFRGTRSTREIAEATGLSTSSLLRWESAVTRPRDRAQLTAVLAELGVTPVAALAYALWPPRQQMVERPRIGQALLEVRTDRGLSTRAAASELGVSQGGFNAWERGRTRPERAYWAAIAEWLGVSEDHVATLVAPRREDLYGRPALARELVARRRAHYRSVDQVSGELGVSRSTVRSYEKGQRVPAVTKVPAYASAVGADATELAFTLRTVDRSSATFGELLACLRAGKGDTARAASKELGCTHTQLTQWENNRCLPRTTARRERLLVAAQEYFGVSRSELDAALGRTTEQVDPFAVWLRDVMETSGLTCAQLTRAMGLSRQSHARAWLHGQSRPGIGRSKELARFLGVPKSAVERKLAIRLSQA